MFIVPEDSTRYRSKLFDIFVAIYLALFVLTSMKSNKLTASMPSSTLGKLYNLLTGVFGEGMRANIIVINSFDKKRNQLPLRTKYSLALQRANNSRNGVTSNIFF